MQEMWVWSLVGQLNPCTPSTESASLNSTQQQKTPEDTKTQHRDIFKNANWNPTLVLNNQNLCGGGALELINELQQLQLLNWKRLI